MVNLAPQSIRFFCVAFWVSSFLSPVFVLAAPVGTNNGGIQSEPVKPRCFGEVLPVIMDQVPEGKFKNQLAALDPGIREKALKKLGDLRIPLNDVSSLNVDSNGVLFYGCDGLVKP
jgi:hypothetical protein